ncbi:MAG: hypothetical protein Q8M76_15995, partial [Spirochaetaceae bacterium]|nr:hypothetical protein [Spirochaetaceae bacterium]
MKKALLIALTALVAVSFSFAQDAAPAPAPSLGEAGTEHYSVMSELGQERADSLSLQLEAYFELYNAVFRFDPAEMKAKLNVREFAEKVGFDSYLGQVVGQTKDDFVYLHYPSPERSELLVFAKDDPDFSASLAHQGFVQFVKAFVPNPPLWMREGLAVCFESAVWYDATGTVEFPENLAWLETVKALKERNLLMPLDRLLEIGQEEARSELDIFYPQAWAFASFLMNSGDKSYNRLLWDAIKALQADATLEDNQAQVYRIVDTWYGIGLAERDFASYLDERKTFSE